MIVSTFAASVESVAAADRLSMGELAAIVTARTDSSGERVEFKISRDTMIKIGTRISVVIEVEG